LRQITDWKDFAGLGTVHFLSGGGGWWKCEKPLFFFDDDETPATFLSFPPTVLISKEFIDMESVSDLKLRDAPPIAHLIKVTPFSNGAASRVLDSLRKNVQDRVFQILFPDDRNKEKDEPDDELDDDSNSDSKDEDSDSKDEDSDSKDEDSDSEDEDSDYKNKDSDYKDEDDTKAVV